MKVRPYGDFSHPGSLTGIIIRCPACDEILALDERWSWNGNMEAPTIDKSVIHSHRIADKKYRLCHFRVVDGMVHYGTDSAHDQAGKVLPLPGVFSDEEENERQPA